MSNWRDDLRDLPLSLPEIRPSVTNFRKSERPTGTCALSSTTLILPGLLFSRQKRFNKHCNNPICSGLWQYWTIKLCWMHVGNSFSLHVWRKNVSYIILNNKKYSEAEEINLRFNINTTKWLDYITYRDSLFHYCNC